MSYILCSLFYNFSLFYFPIGSLHMLFTKTIYKNSLILTSIWYHYYSCASKNIFVISRV